MEAVVSTPSTRATKHFDKTKPFLCQDEAPWGSRVSILSVAIAVRSAIAEYSRLVIAYIDEKKSTQLRECLVQ
jgi:hypothetical protein